MRYDVRTCPMLVNVVYLRTVWGAVDETDCVVSYWQSTWTYKSLGRVHMVSPLVVSIWLMCTSSPSSVWHTGSDTLSLLCSLSIDDAFCIISRALRGGDSLCAYRMYIASS
jgi:hypothetical protein